MVYLDLNVHLPKDGVEVVVFSKKSTFECAFAKRWGGGGGVFKKIHI